MDMTLSIASLSTTTSPTREQAGGPAGRTNITVNGIGGLSSNPVIKGLDYESAIRGTPDIYDVHKI